MSSDKSYSVSIHVDGHKVGKAIADHIEKDEEEESKP